MMSNHDFYFAAPNTHTQRRRPWFLDEEDILFFMHLIAFPAIDEMHASRPPCRRLRATLPSHYHYAAYIDIFLTCAFTKLSMSHGGRRQYR